MAEIDDGATPDDSWRDFCAALADAGEVLGTAKTELDQAEGVRFLSRLIGAGLEIFLENNDPLRPRLSDIVTPERKFGIDSPDATYHSAPLGPGLAYRLTGNRNDAAYLALTVYSGSASDLASARVVANIADPPVDPGGSFQIVLAPPGHPLANTAEVELETGAATLLLREYLLDREIARPAAYRLECLDHAGRPQPLTLEPTTQSLSQAAAFVRAISELMPGKVAELAREPNTLHPLSGGQGAPFFAAPDIACLIGYFNLPPEKALVVEGDSPNARYWGFHLCNIWGESLDYERHRVSINNAEIELEDGRFRIVVSSANPGSGEPNWVSTAGHTEGLMAFRNLPGDRPLGIACEVIDFASLALWSEI